MTDKGLNYRPNNTWVANLLRNKIRSFRYKMFIVSVMAATMLSLTTASIADTVATRRFEDFPALRGDLLEMIGSATTRVWLVSDFLSDGELVAALYIAQYRKINVQVLLGREKANNYMSRLTFLRSQGIPVFLAPQQFPNFGTTALLIDEKLLSVDTSLDFMSKGRPYTITYENQPRTRQFMASFAESANQKIPVQTIPMRSTFRNQNQKERVIQFRSIQGRAEEARRREDNPDTYYYGGGSAQRPAEVPSTLPKKTKWQLKLEKQFNHDQNSNGGPLGEDPKIGKSVDRH